MSSLAHGVQFNVEHSFRNGKSLTRFVCVGILDRMLQIEQDSRRCSEVAVIEEYSAAPQQIPVALQRDVKGGVEKWMPRANKCRKRLSLGSDQALLESNPFVALEYWISRANRAISISDGSGYVSDLVASWLALANSSTQSLKRLSEEGFDVMGLKAPGIGSLHIFSNTRYAARVHRVMRKCALFQEVLEVGAVHSILDGFGQTCANVGAFAVADCFDK